MEQAGIIHHGALVFSTIANLKVPHLCVVVRKAYTAGLYALGGPGFDADKFLAFPNSSINIYGEKALDSLGKEVVFQLKNSRSWKSMQMKIAV